MSEHDEQEPVSDPRERLVAVKDIVDAAEIARRLHYTDATVRGWKTGRRSWRRPGESDDWGFPAPLPIDAGHRDLWDWNDVLWWAQGTGHADAWRNDDETRGGAR